MNMQSDSIQDSTRYVVSTRHVGGILPGRREEMWRDVYLLEGAEIGGGIFGNNLLVEGQRIRVEGAVYVRGSIRITSKPGAPHSRDTVDFMSAVATPDSILFDDHCEHQVRFFADIFTGQAKIHNALIRGNVFASNAIIRNSVILGGVFCMGNLTLQHVVLGTFRAKKVNLQPEIMMFYPFAIADEPLKLTFPIKALSFMNLREFLTNTESLGDGVVLIDDEDVVRVTERENDEEKSFHMISLGSRIFDLEEVKRQFRQNKRVLEYTSLGDHLDPLMKVEFERNELAQIEQALFQLIERPPRQETAVRTPFETMSKRDSVHQYMESLASMSKT